MYKQAIINNLIKLAGTISNQGVHLIKNLGARLQWARQVGDVQEMKTVLDLMRDRKMHQLFREGTGSYPGFTQEVPTGILSRIKNGIQDTILEAKAFRRGNQIGKKLTKRFPRPEDNPWMDPTGAFIDKGTRTYGTMSKADFNKQFGPVKGPKGKVHSAEDIFNM